MNIISLRKEIEYLREENRAKTLIIKQLTEIKATINPTNTSGPDRTTQNSDNVIDKAIQNNNKEPFKNKKSTDKHLANTKTLKNEKDESPNGKNTSEANENKKQKKKKEDDYKETTNRNNDNRNNKNKTFIFLATASLKN